MRLDDILGETSTDSTKVVQKDLFTYLFPNVAQNSTTTEFSSCTGKSIRHGTSK